MTETRSIIGYGLIASAFNVVMAFVFKEMSPLFAVFAAVWLAFAAWCAFNRKLERIVVAKMMGITTKRYDELRAEVDRMDRQ